MPQDGKRALLIVNRSSGRGGQDLEEGLERLRAAGIALDERAPRSPREVPEIIRAAADSVELVILAGGDGTMSLAAPALLETGLPLGIIPTGTANDLARTLGIPFTIAGACAVIAGGRRQAIDVGQVNDRYFFNVASLGLSVSVARRLTRKLKRRFGVLSYPMAVFDAARAMRSFRAEIVCDDESLSVRTIQIAVGNGRYYGGGMAVADDAAIDDELLDLYSLPPVSLSGLIGLVPFLWLGKHGRWREVRLVRGKTIKIRTAGPRSINTDGEVTTRTPAVFRVIPGAVSVFAPAGSSAKGISKHAAQ